MRRISIVVLVVSILVGLGACGPKPLYKTREGKRKTRYYNAVQFGNPNVPDPPSKKKKKKR